MVFSSKLDHNHCSLFAFSNGLNLLSISNLFSSLTPSLPMSFFLSNFSTPAKHLLEPLLLSYSSSSVLNSILRSSLCKQSQSLVLNSVLESYSSMRMIPEALDSFRFIMVCQCVPSTRCCNAFLESVLSSSHTQKAWNFHALALRIGMVPDSRTWSLLAKLFCIEGKLENSVKVLSLSCCDASAYDLVVGCYSKKGDFRAVIHLLRVMTNKGLALRFSTYGAVLDGGCEFGDAGVVGFVLKVMIVKGLLPMAPCFDYNWIIRKLCESDKTFAAEMFFEKARKWERELDNVSFVCLLKALSRTGRVEHALKLFDVMSQKGVGMDNGCLDVFVNSICKGEPSKKANSVLKDVLAKGFAPKTCYFSDYVAELCREGSWIEAGDLWNAAMEKSILLNAHCSNSLLEHYCCEGLVDSAMLLHDKLMKLGGCLDATAYNSLLRVVLVQRRIEAAIRVFDYMRERNVLSSSNYIIMISAFCQEKEMRKAMELHDEMVKVGLKPDDSIYKHLISEFA
ncbi:pentatricopeptide repeat-containing protein At4g21170 [Dioscorea cayenensis subsp. rotundata]|uniref:Pentatricopeptide repeat-containing protein At4g21170 n=1 Tax=Dioscorea cayennensis subsp. rotundata TaxID=55577 RepID=A0AB40AXU7_DIOCR|nr:pentatricopeptide repeat-containing protein At4g21170 [Dioscorea cayenensis subsp. rotundata]